MNKITFTVEVITPELAKEYLLSNTKNRTLSKRTVLLYADIMRRGQWELTHEGISFDGYGRLLDGQHRLEAIISSGVSVKMVVARGLSSDTFAVINTGKTRSTGDTFSISGIKDSNNMASGVRKYLNMKTGYETSSGKSNTFITNLDVVNEYESDWAFYDNCLHVAARYYGQLRLLTRSEYFAIYAFLIKEMNHSSEKVEEFFDQLNSYSDIKAINLFRQRVLLSNASKTKLTPSFKIALLIKCWNAFVLRKDLKVLKYDEKVENYPVFI